MKKLVERTQRLSFKVIAIVIMGIFSSVYFAQPAAPNVSVEIVTIDDVGFVRLSWEQVEGAVSYNIYTSTSTDSINWREPIAIVVDTVFLQCPGKR